jgi:hypothetical protein
MKHPIATPAVRSSRIDLDAIDVQPAPAPTTVSRAVSYWRLAANGPRGIVALVGVRLVRTVDQRVHIIDSYAIDGAPVRVFDAALRRVDQYGVPGTLMLERPLSQLWTGVQVSVPPHKVVEPYPRPDLVDLTAVHAAITGKSLMRVVGPEESTARAWPADLALCIIGAYYELVSPPTREEDASAKWTAGIAYTESRVDEVMRSVHRLAAFRYNNVDEADIRILFKPEQRSDATPEVGFEAAPLESRVAASDGPTTYHEAADACAWSAQVYMGGGKWGDIRGVGATVPEALWSLHHAMTSAHEMVDARRRGVYERAEAIALKAGLRA